jgi:hypothetical protein
MSARHVRAWEETRARLEQADKGERQMTVSEYDRLNKKLDRIEQSGRADTYPPGQDPRPFWRR